MSETTEIAFTGELLEAQCECHKGQWIGVAYLLHPQKGSIVAGTTMFKTKALGEEHLAGFVTTVAQDHLAKHGLDIKDAKDIRVSHGQDADRETRRFFKTESNDKLH